MASRRHKCEPSSCARGCQLGRAATAPSATAGAAAARTDHARCPGAAADASGNAARHVELLEASEQALFRQAAVFAGGWNAPGSGGRGRHHGICAGRAERPTSLLDKILVQVQAPTGISGELRFRMLAGLAKLAAPQMQASTH